MSKESGDHLVANVGELQSYKIDIDQNTITDDRMKKRRVPYEAWRSCFRHFDGTIYLADRNKTVDGGKSIVKHDISGLDKISIHQFIGIPRPDKMDDRPQPGPEGTVFSRPGLFLALDGRMYMESPGVYHARCWRSTDNLETITEENVVVNVPEGPQRNWEPGEWYGIWITRGIVEMPDGSLLATAQGNFAEDTIEPSSGPGKDETHYLCRVFVITSNDDGKTWNYLSTMAAPNLEDPIDEGFGEPTIILLDNGQLLCIMRTGHHRPLYACWSSDQGKTWTDPLYTGLERGCAPHMVKLTDGRLAVIYGNRFPPGWSRITPGGDHTRWYWPGPGLVKLAINSDGTGKDWEVTTIGREMGSVYPTMFEVEPNVLFCQVDGWCWRVTLKSKK